MFCVFICNTTFFSTFVLFPALMSKHCRVIKLSTLHAYLNLKLREPDYMYSGLTSAFCKRFMNFTQCKRLHVVCFEQTKVQGIYLFFSEWHIISRQIVVKVLDKWIFQRYDCKLSFCIIEFWKIYVSKFDLPAFWSFSSFDIYVNIISWL